MHTKYPQRFHRSLILSTILLGLASTLSAPCIHAEDEIRAGAVLQIPFSLGSTRPLLDYTTIRVGLTCQYASVEEDEVITTHHVTNTFVNGTQTDSTEETTVEVDEGNQVRGVEGNLAIAPFNGFNPSVELLGFYGTNHIQGAFGGGDDFEDSFFFDGKVMLPYGEIGLRFPQNVEIYGGVKTLGSFDPAQEAYRQDLLTTIDETHIDTRTVTTVVVSRR